MKWRLRWKELRSWELRVYFTYLNWKCRFPRSGDWQHPNADEIFHQVVYELPTSGSSMRFTSMNSCHSGFREEKTVTLPFMEVLIKKVVVEDSLYTVKKSGLSGCSSCQGEKWIFRIWIFELGLNSGHLFYI